MPRAVSPFNLNQPGEEPKLPKPEQVDAAVTVVRKIFSKLQQEEAFINNMIKECEQSPKLNIPLSPVPKLREAFEMSLEELEKDQPIKGVALSDTTQSFVRLLTAIRQTEALASKILLPEARPQEVLENTDKIVKQAKNIQAKAQVLKKRQEELKAQSEEMKKSWNPLKALAGSAGAEFIDKLEAEAGQQFYKTINDIAQQAEDAVQKLKPED